MELISLNLPSPPEFVAGFRNDGGSSTLANPSADFIQSLIGFPAAAGKIVTRDTAVRVAAFLAGAKMLANDIAKLPLILRETAIVKGRQRTQPALENPLYSILKDSPNDWHTSYQMRWFLAFQLVTACNCFCQKIVNGKGEILKLVPLNAWYMTPQWDRTNPKQPVLFWKYADGENQKVFKQSEIWHTTSTNIEGMGIEGTAIIALAKEALSVLMAAEETAGRNFANGLAMAGFISFPPDVEVTEAQGQNVVDRVKKDFSGSQNAGKFTTLPYGGKFEKMSFNAQESQLLESRKWNEEEVVRLLGGAPLLVKLGLGAQSSTYASSTAFLDEYFNTSIFPYTTAIEQSITRDLIAPSDRGKLYAKHNADIILRGSPKERADEYKIRIQSGQMTLNEARVLEDRDTIEGADVLQASANSCIFDPETQEWFIPGQLVPEPEDGEGTTAPSDEQEPDAEGNDETNDGNQPPAQKPSKKAPAKKKPNAAQARLELLANSLAERVMRKEAKGGIDAKFVVEVMNVSKEKAEAYIASRKALNDQEARAALVALAQGE